MLHRTKLKIVFIVSMVAGIGLCIGGIFLAPLLVPGGILIAAGLGMFQSAFTAEDVELHTQSGLEMVRLSPEQQQRMVIEQNVGVFFVYQNRESAHAQHDPQNTTHNRLMLT